MTEALLGIDRDSSDHRVLAGQVCRACVAGLDIDGASISVLTASVARETLWASDPTAQLLEDLQYSLGEGACMQAATTGFPVLVPDLHHSTQVARWPIFAAAVAEQTRVRALFAFPLQFGVINLGVLDLYRIRPGGLSQQQWRDGLAATEIAAVMMLEIRTDPDDPDGYDDSDAPWLDPSLGSRAEIHQATGMVIAQLAITATEALARLRAHAFSHHRLLLEVAADVVARRLVFTEDMR
ncbi:MAG: GAF and ANTAR domain-containing protein [Pseudonocardiales bacterium]|nr:GAF and ANTAR domain-containing protein [Pseudonocardiales bacterium]